MSFAVITEPGFKSGEGSPTPARGAGEAEDAGNYPANAVVLNVYDITELNASLVSFGLGAHHAGVEVYGKEYAFGSCPDGSGIMCNTPRFCPPHIMREQLLLGVTPLDEVEVAALIRQLTVNPLWLGGTYDLLRHNCLHFVDALVAALKPVRPEASSHPCEYYTGCASSASDGIVPAYVSRLQKLVLQYVPRHLLDKYVYGVEEDPVAIVTA